MVSTRYADVHMSALRITRVKGNETVYFLHHGSWTTLARGYSNNDRAIPVLGMTASASPDRPFGHQDAQVAFDNFVVTEPAMVNRSTSILLLGFVIIAVGFIYFMRLRSGPRGAMASVESISAKAR